MAYHIGDIVEPDTDGMFPSELYQWLMDNNAHIEYTGNPTDGMHYVITSDQSPQFKEQRIYKLKHLLAESDYKAIKYAEGEITEEEYAPIKEQRRQWRAEINQLEESE